MPSRPPRRLHVLPLEDRTVPAVVDLAAGTLSFTAAAGETNTVNASVSGGRFHFEQTGGAPLTLSARASAAGWTVDGTGKVSGGTAGVSAVDIKLGDRDDALAFDGFQASVLRLTADGGGGHDTLAVGSAAFIPGNDLPQLTDPQRTGVGVAGDATFKNFTAATVYRFIAAGGTVNFTNADTATPLNVTVNRSINASAVNVVGGSGDDSLTVDYRGPTGAEIVLPHGLTYDGGAGTNALTVGGATAGGHTFAADGTRVSRDGAAAITLTRVQSVALVGGPVGDAFAVTPAAATAFSVQGDAGDDTLTVQAGAAVVGLTATQSGRVFGGTATVAGMREVRFAGVESVAPRPAALIDVSSPSGAAAAGRTVTFTITVANSSATTPLANVAIADLLPAQFTNATWTVAAAGGSTASRTSGTGPVATTVNLAPGGMVTVTVVAQVRPDTDGLRPAYRATATAPASTLAGASSFTAELAMPIRRASRPSVPPADLYAVGSGPGAEPRVVVFGRQGGPARFNFLAYDAAFRGGVNVATADVTGDGVEDVITAPGAGGGPHVKVFDGVTGALVREFMAYDTSFRGGVNVAAGYVSGDARADVITAPASMGGPHVKVFDGGTGAVALEFMAFDAAFTGGVSVAAGDLSTPVFLGAVTLVAGQPPLPQFSSADGIDDIIVAAGAGGAPQVKVFDGQTGRVTRDFLAYDASFRGGVSVAAGDVNGDGRADIVTAPGVGGGPQVKVFGGAYDQYVGRWQGELGGFLAFDAAGRSGYRVTTADLNGDGKADILTATGPGVAGRVAATDGATGQLRFVFGPFDPSALGGVSIG